MTGSNGTFMIDIQSDRGAVAFVSSDEANAYHTTVHYASKEQLEAMGTVVCDGKMIHGSLSAPVSGGFLDFVTVNLGQSSATLAFGEKDFELLNVADGPLDLFAAKGAYLGGGTPRIIIRRGIDLPNHGTITPPLDFAGEGFDAAQATLTLNGMNGEQAIALTTYALGLDGTRGSGAIHTETIGSGATQRTIYGVPQARQADGDLHILVAATFGGAAFPPPPLRAVTRLFSTLANQTLTLGPTQTAPTVSAPNTAPYVRPQVSYPIQAEYDRHWSAGFTQAGAGTRGATLTMTSDYHGGGGTLVLTVPDFSGVAGWNNAWGMVPGSQVTWQFNASGWTLPGGIDSAPSADGAEVLSSSRWGTFTP